MRVLVLSDIHSNLDALEAVLADADGAYDRVWCLGDVVGYGPEPNQCVARLAELDHVGVAGNHDWAALGRADVSDFNPDARRAALWTREQLTPASVAYLQALPETHREGAYTLVHGSPRNPIWEYVLYASVAALAMRHLHTDTCLVGHTHMPAVFEQAEEGTGCQVYVPEEGTELQLGGARRIVNPGGVGQPRDGDPRAAYALLDTDADRIAFRRVAYDIAATQAKMSQAGLPARLIARLEYGW